MSTLCRAKQGPRNVRGSRPSRSLCGASRAALQYKDVFGGTPNTACGTHALPTHLSALLNDPQGNQTERVHGSHSSPECIRGSSDDFFCPRRIRPFFAPFALCDFAFNSSIKNPTPSHCVAVSRSDLEKGSANLSGQFQGNSKRFKVIQTKKRKNSCKIYDPFVPFRGHPVIVNPRNRFGFRTVKPMSRLDSRHFVCKYFTMNDLHNNQPSGGSRSVKPGQTDPRMPNALPSLCSFAAIPCGCGASRAGPIHG